MGFFSFEGSKSKVSIPAYGYNGTHKKYSEVVLITPDDRKIEGVYDGYGHIIDEENDKEYDIFDEIMWDLLLLRGNDPESKDELRKLFFEDYDENIKLVKIVRQDYYDGEWYDQLETSEGCEYQGYFYPEGYVEKHFI